tara:strand:- start:601 stop:726 length:126 start_codon:yes stop_codon:yes gene_type:complete
MCAVAFYPRIENERAQQADDDPRTHAVMKAMKRAVTGPGFD